MLSERVSHTLNRLFETQRFSLADYLHKARPWTRSGDERKLAVVEQIVADHEHDAHRLAEAIAQAGGTIDGGCFPMRFTSLNDLSLEYLLPKLVDAQRGAVAEIEACDSALRDRPMFAALVGEVLGAAKGHLENLLEATGETNGDSGDHRDCAIAA